MDKLLISLLSIICILVILNIAKNIYPNSIEFFQSGDDGDDEDDDDDVDDDDDGEVDEQNPESISIPTEEELLTTLSPETTSQPQSLCSELEIDTSYKGLTKFIFSESDPCQEKIYQYMNIFNNDNLSKNYTLSFLFKTEKDNENKVQYLLNIKNQLSVYIRNNILFVDNFNNVQLLETSIKQKEVPNNLESDITKLIDEEIKDEHRVSFHHFAVICKFNSAENKLDFSIFINGLKGRVSIANQSGFKYTDIEIGKHSFSDKEYNFMGNIMDPKFENKVITETELCSRWNSCGMNECSYKENMDVTSSRKECYENCLKSSDCSEQACNNKCFNRNLSLWAPKCTFNAKGSTKQDCIKQCLSTGSCRFDICSDRCSNCTDIYRCPWIKDTKQSKDFYDRDKLFDPKLLKCKKCIPPILDITVKKNRTITIKWSQPLKLNSEFSDYLFDEHDSEIDMFIFIITKVNKPKEGSELLTYKVKDSIKKKIESFNKKATSEVPIHEFEIKNLDENEEYNIVSKSIKLHKGNCNSSDNGTTRSPADGQNHTISDSSYTYNIIPEVKYKYSSN